MTGKLDKLMEYAIQLQPCLRQMMKLHRPHVLITTLTILVEMVIGMKETSYLHHVRTFEPISYDHISLLTNHRRVRSTRASPLRLQFHAFARQFSLHLYPDDFKPHSNFIVQTSTLEIPHEITQYSGHIEEESSRIHGIITNTGHFEGSIITNNETYFLEKSIHNFAKAQDFHSVVYKLSDVTLNRNTSCAHEQLLKKQKELTKKVKPTVHNFEKDHDKLLFQNENEKSEEWTYRYRNYANNSVPLSNIFIKQRRFKREIDPTKTLCQLYMQVDHLFYQKYGSDVDTVIEKMTQYVQALNAIYTIEDFDGSGSPDNIGFIISKITIHDDPTVAGYTYNGNFAVDYFLDLHSKENYDQFCLSYLFTYRDFSDGVLGLAWVGSVSSAGGVCEKYAVYQGEGKSLNTGIVTNLNYGMDVPSAVVQVTFAHEVGHNFGSGHDPETTGSACSPGGDSGNYIMYPRATSGALPNNDKMSSCSKTAIQEVLEAKARGTDGCFIGSTNAICGNRVVEGDEECDCGWTDECQETCCNPQLLNPSSGETPCTYKSSVVCSPSEGVCCTSTCQWAADGTSCKDESLCSEEAFCNGANATCTPSAHKADRVTCGDSNDFQVCLNGECSGYICLAHSRTACQCPPGSTGDASDKQLCEVCCKDDNDVCTSSYALDDIPDAELVSGSPCNDYKGYCDVFKKCRLVDPSGPLSNLKKLILSGEAFNTVKDFLTKHWYIGLVAGLGLVIIIALVVKFCSKSHKPDKDTPTLSRDMSVIQPQPSRRNRVSPTSWM